MAERNMKQSSRTMLSIGEACHLLGVSDAALRQWTDEGKVKAFVTPGGHRRYAEADLRALLRQGQRAHGLRELGDRVEAVVPREREVVRQYMMSSAWYRRLDDAAKSRLRERGTRLVDALVLFVTRPGFRDRVTQECRKIGREYGTDLAGTGLSLSESIEAFILHREPVIEAVMGMMTNSVPLSKQAQSAVPQINKLIDVTLLALVETHQGHSASAASRELEGD